MWLSQDEFSWNFIFGIFTMYLVLFQLRFKTAKNNIHYIWIPMCLYVTDLYNGDTFHSASYNLRAKKRLTIWISRIFLGNAGTRISRYLLGYLFFMRKVFGQYICYQQLCVQMGRTRNDWEKSGRSKHIFSCEKHCLHFYNRELRQKINNAVKAKEFKSSFKIYVRPPISRRVVYKFNISTS